MKRESALGTRDPARTAKRLVDKLTGQPRHFRADDMLEGDDLRAKLEEARKLLAAEKKQAPKAKP